MAFQGCCHCDELFSHDRFEDERHAVLGVVGRLQWVATMLSSLLPADQIVPAQGGSPFLHELINRKLVFAGDDGNRGALEQWLQKLDADMDTAPTKFVTEFSIYIFIYIYLSMSSRLRSIFPAHFLHVFLSCLFLCVLLSFF